MKKFLALFGIIIVINVSAQDSLYNKATFEFGSTIASVNSFRSTFNYEPDRPNSEFLNGIFFRFTKKRFGVRFNTFYSENRLNFDLDNSNNIINNRDIRIGFGGQYSPFKNANFIYGYLDFSYRNVISNIDYSSKNGLITGKASKTSNGFDTNFGLGFKLKITKSLFLSPEIGYIFATKFIKNNRFSNDFYYGIKNKNYTFYHFTPNIKLNLTAKF